MVSGYVYTTVYTTVATVLKNFMDGFNTTKLQYLTNLLQWGIFINLWHRAFQWHLMPRKAFLRILLTSIIFI